MASAILPPCNSVRLCAMERPRPLPSVERELSPRTKRSISSAARLFERQVDARAVLGVLADVREQVVDHAPHQRAVHAAEKLLFRHDAHKRQLGRRQLVAVFALHLCQKFVHAAPHGVHRQVAGRRLARLDQIFGELFELEGLPLEHGEVFFLLLARVLVLQEVHIVDDARQRRFDVVRDVRDELRFEPLAFELLVDGRGHAVADGI